MKTSLEKITARAKQIRKAHPAKAWIECIKAASKQISGVSRKAKPAAKKAKPAATKKAKDPNRQTGSSSKLHDAAIQAKQPGKRAVKEGRKTHYYYERRKNRSDKPGSLTGTHNLYEFQKIPGRISREITERELASKKLESLKEQYRETRSVVEKRRISKDIKQYTKMLQAAKDNISNLKKLL